jgi:hypothetical protein
MTTGEGRTVATKAASSKSRLLTWAYDVIDLGLLAIVQDRNNISILLGNYRGRSTRQYRRHRYRSCNSCRY